MFSIGDLARYGRVSVRMLRHYDAIGLLPPARVDPGTGYRLYTADQLATLNRIVALKELGFSLAEVGTLLGERVPITELRGMLRLRRAELEARIAADAGRLAEVESRLRTIESEGTVGDDIVIKKVPAVRLAELSAPAAGFEPRSITPVIRPLYERLMERLGSVGVDLVGPAVAWYEDRGDEGVLVHAGVPVDAAPGDLPEDVTITDLPALEAATVIHRGSMDDCLPSWQALGRWIDEQGHASGGPARETTLEYGDDPATWVTELQQPIAR